MIEPVYIHDVEIIEPYQTSSLDEGLALNELFTSHTIQSVKMFVKRLIPHMMERKARILEPFLAISEENFCEPIKDYRTLNGDGLISICMKVHDHSHRHKIAVYDHVKEQLKYLGSIPRHHFEMSVDQSVFCLNEPQFVEGVIGAMTEDAQFVAIFSHSKNLRVLSVFNIPDAVCLIEKDLSRSKFFQGCQPTGVALGPTGPSSSQFNIAILSCNMEVRVWNTGDNLGKIVRLEDCHPSYGLGLSVINHRESFLRFSPDGQYLCVLAYVESMCMCVVMDAISLQALYRMPYDFTYGHLCCIFPCFTIYGSRFAMFAPNNGNYYDIKNYQLYFYQIPQTLQCLKNLCRLSILRVVDRSNLSKLPVPQGIILFLTGSANNVSEDSYLPGDSQRRCHLM